jgi:2-hydroxy-6-oxonona-2,4-dienedioate hydrolase
LNYFDFSKFTYYFIDLRGYGHSSYNKAIETIQDFSEDVKLFIEVKYKKKKIKRLL